MILPKSSPLQNPPAVRPRLLLGDKGGGENGDPGFYTSYPKIPVPPSVRPSVPPSVRPPSAPTPANNQVALPAGRPGPAAAPRLKLLAGGVLDRMMGLISDEHGLHIRRGLRSAACTDCAGLADQMALYFPVRDGNTAAPAPQKRETHLGHHPVFLFSLPAPSLSPSAAMHDARH